MNRNLLHSEILQAWLNLLLGATTSTWRIASTEFVLSSPSYYLETIALWYAILGHNGRSGHLSSKIAEYVCCVSRILTKPVANAGARHGFLAHVDYRSRATTQRLWALYLPCAYETTDY